MHLPSTELRPAVVRFLVILPALAIETPSPTACACSTVSVPALALAIEALPPTARARAPLLVAPTALPVTAGVIDKDVDVEITGDEIEVGMVLGNYVVVVAVVAGAAPTMFTASGATCGAMADLPLRTSSLIKSIMLYIVA